MAGGFGKQDPKNHKYTNGSNNEIYKFSGESSTQDSRAKASKFSLNGILNIGQSVDFNKDKPQQSTWKPEFLGINHLQKEQEVIIQQQQAELQKEINELRAEIKNLVLSAQDLESEVEQAIAQPVIEANQYQLSVLQRIKKVIINFTRNISQASIWLDSFKGKKQKHNAFWGNVKNKKNGGEQYLFSSEHTASRSAN